MVGQIFWGGVFVLWCLGALAAACGNGPFRPGGSS